MSTVTVAATKRVETRSEDHTRRRRVLCNEARTRYIICTGSLLHWDSGQQDTTDDRDDAMTLAHTGSSRLAPDHTDSNEW